MKKILLGIGLFITATTYAQSDSMPRLNMAPIGLYGDLFAKGEYLLEINDHGDSVIGLYGDTLSAIQHLYNWAHRLDSIQGEYYKFMSIVVDYTNCIPDIWKDKKTNLAWRKLNNFINKNGYYSVKAKPIDARNCSYPAPH